MNKFRKVMAVALSSLSVALLLALSLSFVGQVPDVAIETEFGVIEIALEKTRAPKTTANFLRYVDSGAYSGGKFWRTVTMNNQLNSPMKIQVIQGAALSGKKDFPPIPLERTRDTGLRHLNGTISMGRDASDTATSDFFVCIGDQPELDFGGKRHPDSQGFAAFGRVVKGMEVVRKIQAQPEKEQSLTPPVTINRIRRLAIPFQQQEGFR